MAALIGRYLGLVAGAFVVMAGAAGAVARIWEDSTARNQQDGVARTQES